MKEKSTDDGEEEVRPPEVCNTLKIPHDKNEKEEEEDSSNP